MSASTDSSVLASVRDGVLVLCLNRPEKLNAINYGVIATLMQHLSDSVDDDNVRAVLLRGEGRAFCAGDDVVGMGEPPYSVPPGEHPVRHMQQRLIRQWFWYPKPTVVALHGRCHGIGGDIALSADFRIVSDELIYGDLRARRAIPVGSGGTWLLPRMIGLPRATAIMLTGGTVGAAELDAAGLATEVVPAESIQDRAMAFATTMAAGPTKAIGFMKRELRKSLTTSFDEALALEISLLDEPVEDREEGRRSFAEKRDPVYTGR
jgi:2-(1,2-epoxy-1,2-dihydrophenyl)acetyl-CoA isomerase